MKKFLASIIFIFLILCVNLCALDSPERKKEILKEYIQQRILNLCDQLDDISYEEEEKYSFMHGFLSGKRTAYLEIWIQLQD